MNSCCTSIIWLCTMQNKFRLQGTDVIPISWLFSWCQCCCLVPPPPPLSFPRGGLGTVTWQPSPRGWWGTVFPGVGKDEGRGGYLSVRVQIGG